MTLVTLASHCLPLRLDLDRGETAFSGEVGVFGDLSISFSATAAETLLRFSFLNRGRRAADVPFGEGLLGSTWLPSASRRLGPVPGKHFSRLNPGQSPEQKIETPSDGNHTVYSGAAEVAV